MTGIPVRILLVEDSSDDVLFFRRAAAKAGLTGELLLAEDGDVAVSSLSRDPRLTHVLLDLKLPKRHGLDVLHWIRNQSPSPGTPVIVLTSSNEKTDQEKAKLLGVDRYLIKPVSFPKLVETVREIGTAWGLLDPRVTVR